MIEVRRVVDGTFQIDPNLTREYKTIVFKDINNNNKNLTSKIVVVNSLKMAETIISQED